MKKIITILTAAAAALALTACGGGNKNLSTLNKDIDSAAYILGYLNGAPYADGLRTFPGDSIDYKLFADGFEDALMRKDQKMSVEEMQMFLQRFLEKAQAQEMEKFEALKEENKKEGEEFLAGNKDKEGVVALESGLQYKVEKLGDGVQATSPKDTVLVHYKGTFLNGEQFDSSYDRNEPTEFPLDRVIRGWTEAFQLVPAGTKFTIWIPGHLAYGENAPQNIGPNKLLRFDCELLEVHPYVEKE